MDTEHREAIERGELVLCFVVALVASASLGLLTRGPDVSERAVHDAERIEVRCYHGTIIVPDAESSLMAFLERTRWRFANPGQARIVSAMARVSARTVLHTPQQVFEELGYRFPPGCYAQIAVGHRVEVAHYPSVLRKMEKDLNLPRVER